MRWSPFHLLLLFFTAVDRNSPLSLSLCVQKEFIDRYESFTLLVAKVYPGESLPAVAEMKSILANM